MNQTMLGVAALGGSAVIVGGLLSQTLGNRSPHKPRAVAAGAALTAWALTCKLLEGAETTPTELWTLSLAAAVATSTLTLWGLKIQGDTISAIEREIGGVLGATGTTAQKVDPHGTGLIDVRKYGKQCSVWAINTSNKTIPQGRKITITSETEGIYSITPEERR
jgi:hypothetical protein